MTDPHGLGVTGDEVEALLDSDFSGQLRHIARRVIRRCEHLPESRRVAFAVLKLAQGDVALLEHFVERAEGDYRDVLYWAFYADR